jgi:hypothetical protein
MGVLLDKPFIVVIPPGVEPNAGLVRIAQHVIRLEHGLETDAGQWELQSGLAGIFDD